MEYSDHFRRAHARIASGLPIHRFARLANPQALGVSSRKDFFAPVRFSVHAQTEGHGIIRMDIPVHSNPNWMTELKTRLAGTLSIPSSKTIDLRTVTGKPLEKVEVHNLRKVGKLNIYVDGKLKRFDKMPEVPIEYSVTKRQELRKWHTNVVVRDLPLKIADELHQKTAVQVNAAIRPDGSVMKIISTHLKSNLPPSIPEGGWAEFVRVHHVNSPIKKNEEDADVALHTISLAILSHIRNFVGASRETIGEYVSSLENKDLNLLLGPVEGKLAKQYAPVLGHFKSGSAVVNGLELYSRLADEALKTPALERSIIHILYQAPQHSTKKIRTELIPIRKVASHHPWYAQIHHTLLPMRGKFPSNYIVGHTKRNMTADAPYTKGDMLKTYHAYHLYSGQHLAPPPLLVLGCGHPMTKKKKAHKQVDCHAAANHAGARMAKSHGKKTKGSRYIKSIVDVGDDHPGIVPLNDSYSTSSRSGSTSSSNSDEEYLASQIAPIRARPKTTPLIATPSPEDDEEYEEFDDVGLPTVSDIFKK